MKKVLSIVAFCIGLATQTFAQFGQGQCAWNIESVPYNQKQQIVSFPDIVLLGISDGEGDPAYSVSLTANFGTGEASKVVLTEIKTNKKWLMNQVSLMTKPLPSPCLVSGQGLGGQVKAYKSALTNKVVYVCVPLDALSVYVYAYKPMDIKLKL